jgi:hypothetical protein
MGMHTNPKQPTTQQNEDIYTLPRGAWEREEFPRSHRPDGNAYKPQTINNTTEEEIYIHSHAEHGSEKTSLRFFKGA